MRLLFCCVSLLLSAAALQAQSPKAVADYVEKYKNIAIEEMKLTGIPASVTLAQGIHESGCGGSVLACKSNNHFGIKCHTEWSGVTYHHDDDHPQECFRVYVSPEQSFKDHSDFLRSRPRYAGLFKLEITDYRGWARGLKAAGYATNPRYPEVIIKLIEDYKLSEFDKGIDKPLISPLITADASRVKSSAPQTIQVTEPSKIKPTPAQVIAEASKPKTPTPAEVARPKTVTAIASPTAETLKPKTSETTSIPVVKASSITNIQLDERLINTVRAVVYKTSIPVSAIAQKYGLTVDELYAYNDMLPNVKFKEGEYIYLEKKKSETTYYQYEIAQGETMRDVAQKFGVQVLELYKRNGISMDCEPMTGEIIVLRGNREVPLKYRTIERNGPKKSSMEISAPGGDGKYHRVNDSDTLYSIARQYNIPVGDLIKLNGLKDEDIKIGQTLIVSSL